MLLLTPSAPSDVPGATSDWLWAQTTDGQRVDGHGHATTQALPVDTQTVLLLPPHWVSWHQVTVPKVPAARLRAVLEGLLEDRLLDEPGQMHFALAPDGKVGQTVWVAAIRADGLRATVNGLQAAGRSISRIAPMLWPNNTLTVQAFERHGQTWLAGAGPLGVVCAPWQADVSPTTWHALLHSVSDTASPPPPPCQSEPASAAQAEAALQAPPEIVSSAEAMLRSAQGAWDLAQFEFSQSASARRGHWWRDQFRALLHAPAWRPVRWGLAMLVVLQVAALNVTAWREQNALQNKQVQIRQTLTQTFPQIGLVLDAPVQMRRAVAELRQRSGEASPRDLEALLQDLAPAQAQWESLTYDTTQATLQGFRPTAQAARDWQASLQAAGWTVQLEGEPPVLTLKARP